MSLTDDVRLLEWGRRADPYVYFLLAESVERLKIGTTIDLTNRLATLEPMSPVPLRLLGAILGGEQVERWCHYHCFASHAHFEWFQWNAATRSFVEWVLSHGAAAATELCRREMQTDRLNAAGRRPLTQVPKLPLRRSDPYSYLRDAGEEATALGVCPCGICLERFKEPR